MSLSVLPSWDQCMVPVLRALGDQKSRQRREVFELAADELGLTSEQRLEVGTGGEAKYQNRVGWALSYLDRVGAVERPSRGIYRITVLGQTLAEQFPAGITEKKLREYARDGDSWWVSKPSSKAVVDDVVTVKDSVLDPYEQIEVGVGRIHSDVGGALIKRLHAQDPAFFEQAVLDLLMAMGYGGAEGNATRTQPSNDGGIDGVIDQDALGLARIYVQAKRYTPDSSIDRPTIQAFVGALADNSASQGVFITTARYTQGARAFAESVAARVVLIDGDRLARLMIKYGVGVQVKQTYDVVEIDEDFFE
ncbi:restriction endonuclease [Oerskovia enterophila]|uniref:Mrr restriction system protein n=1 Tax=Oerskovia enterophila TaxID=43678 RepID=A0ABX2Y5C1_9CELL|nr:restriction endonuclease [Oerskovia enterophila]OCI30101.1 Mrr restriction system protein [Oerskovia enterophila]